MRYEWMTKSLLSSCPHSWDEDWWILSLRIFGILSSSLLLFLQRFGRYVHQPFSGVYRTWESSRNFELRPLLNVVRSSVKVTEFDKHLKKAGGHSGRNIVEITIKMKTIVQKLLMIKKTYYLVDFTVPANIFLNVKKMWKTGKKKSEPS